MSGNNGGLGGFDFIGDLLEGIGDVFEAPGLILAIALVLLCLWMLRQMWELRPGGGTELRLR
jgi:hypothetical protein